MKLKLCVFDIETPPNALICCCRVLGEKMITFEISARKFQLKELVEFFTCGKYIFVAYNGIHFDSPIINMLIDKYWELYLDRNYLVVAGACYKMAGVIINGDPALWKKYKYMNSFPQLDLMTMMASRALRVGLKSLQITMCYHNVKEMVINWDDFVPVDKLDELIHYCHNDVDSTTELMKLLKNDIQLRMAIQKEFGIDCLSKDGVGIGVDIFTKRICAQIGVSNERQLFSYRQNLEQIVVNDYIPDFIKFQTKEANNVLEFYKNMTLDAEGLHVVGYKPSGFGIGYITPDTSMIQKINNLQHSFGVGGVHSVNQPAVYEQDDKHVIIDADVASLYPSLAILYRFGPAGFKEAFLQVLEDLRTDRLIAKKAKDKLKDTTYKLALNSILGNLRNQYSPYYAPEANIGICVAGQLMLLMLIEECELNGIEVISSNTDGVTVKCPREKVDLFYEICNRWQKLTRLELEYVNYEKIVIMAVNDYVAYKAGYWIEKDGEKVYVPGWSDVKDKIDFDNPHDAVEFNFTYPRLNGESKTINKNNYVKEKGMFITNPRLGKGMDSLIVSKALVNYFGKGIPVEETIRNSTSIWDFVSFQKIGKQYEVEWKEQKQQHINRYYVSRKGGYLYKTKKTTKYDTKTKKEITVLSKQNVLKGYGVELFNEYVERPMSEYNIDYRYYRYACNKAIALLQPIQQTLF